jgi:hypothetical protein
MQRPQSQQALGIYLFTKHLRSACTLLQDVDILRGTSKHVSLLSQFQRCMCSGMDIECMICQCRHDSGLADSEVLWSQMQRPQSQQALYKYWGIMCWMLAQSLILCGNQFHTGSIVSS